MKNKGESQNRNLESLCEAAVGYPKKIDNPPYRVRGAAGIFQYYIYHYSVMTTNNLVAKQAAQAQNNGVVDSRTE
jgi:hypothetical protein